MANGKRFQYFFLSIGIYEGKFGARWPILGKPNPAVISRRYAVSWKRQEIDLTELAKSRWIDKMTMDDLAAKFGAGRTFLVAQLGVIRENPDLVRDGQARRLVKLKEKRFFGYSKRGLPTME